MNTAFDSLTHKMQRAALGKTVDLVLSHAEKDPAKTVGQIVDLSKQFYGNSFSEETYTHAKQTLTDPNSKWSKLINCVLNQLDPNVARTTALNLGYEAFFRGTKTIRENRVKYQCNIPWLILFDPTSACNMHCVGCWAGEYGHKNNLSFDDMDKIVTEGKELGVYLYMLTGGEPLVRKADILKLAEKHNDVQFAIYTNSTLIDEPFCKEVVRLGNIAFMLSIEGTPSTNDARRGEGHYAAVLRRAGDEAPAVLPPEPAARCPQELTDFCARTGAALPEGKLLRFGDVCYLVPQALPEVKGLRVLRAGLELGAVLKNRIAPAHAWALWLETLESSAGLHLIGASVIALFIGMAINAFFQPNKTTAPGIKFTSKKVLKFAIVLLGASLNIRTVLTVGRFSLTVMLFTLATCFGLGALIGRALGLNWKTSSLINAGTGICGGSAIAAIAPVIEADDMDIAYGMSATFLFDTVMIVVFPLLGRWLGLSDAAFGLWAGTAVNDTSSVVATGYAFSEAAGDFATMVKLTRTLAIIPAVLVFAAINLHLKKKESAQANGVKVRIRSIFPWFIPVSYTHLTLPTKLEV